MLQTKVVDRAPPLLHIQLPSGGQPWKATKLSLDRLHNATGQVCAGEVKWAQCSTMNSVIVPHLYTSSNPSPSVMAILCLSSHTSIMCSTCAGRCPPYPTRPPFWLCNKKARGKTCESGDRGRRTHVAHSGKVKCWVEVKWAKQLEDRRQSWVTCRHHCLQWVHKSTMSVPSESCERADRSIRIETQCCHSEQL